MARNVINKHRNGSKYNINKSLFFRDLPSNLSDDEKQKLAEGILYIYNKEGEEGLCILNTKGQVVWVAQSSNAEIPSNILDKISEVSEELKEYADEVVDEQFDIKISNYNSIVVESGTNLYNRIIEYVDNGFEETSGIINTEKAELEAEINELKTTISALTEYISNLKFSDHVLIKENAYEAIMRDHNLVIRIDEDGNWIQEGEEGYETAKEIKYDSEVYYCIPEDGTGPIPDTGSSIDVSGDTIYVYEGSDVVHNEVGDGYTLVLDDSVGIKEDTHAIVINIDDSTPESGADIGDDDNMDLDDDSDVSDDNHTLELSNSFTIRPENNELIIL